MRNKLKKDVPIKSMPKAIPLFSTKQILNQLVISIVSYKDIFVLTKYFIIWSVTKTRTIVEAANIARFLTGFIFIIKNTSDLFFHTEQHNHTKLPLYLNIYHTSIPFNANKQI